MHPAGHRQSEGRVRLGWLEEQLQESKRVAVVLLTLVHEAGDQVITKDLKWLPGAGGNRKRLVKGTNFQPLEEVGTFSH